MTNTKTLLRILPDGSLSLGEVRITFHRTLRIPDDGKSYPLPPSLGHFPIRAIDDYASRVPEEWREKGGIMLPMYQREAMWLGFASTRPNALKVGVGKVCAVSGEPWTAGLRTGPQGYVVTGLQPWLDGIASGTGTIRQFVAMPLGLGYTVEGQVTGEEKHGGLQLECFAPKPGRVPEPTVRQRGMGSTLDEADGYASFTPCKSGSSGVLGGPPMSSALGCPPPPAMCAAAPAAGPYRSAAAAAARPQRAKAMSLGLAAGGRMTQKIYPDPYGVDAWNLDARSRVFVHLCDSLTWREITGEEAPATPVTARSYADAGLPWFELYDEGAQTLSPTEKLAGVKSVKELDAQKSSDDALQDDGSVGIGPVKKLLGTLAAQLGIRDGEW